MEQSGDRSDSVSSSHGILSHMHDVSSPSPTSPFSPTPLRFDSSSMIDHDETAIHRVSTPEPYPLDRPLQQPNQPSESTILRRRPLKRGVSTEAIDPIPMVGEHRRVRSDVSDLFRSPDPERKLHQHESFDDDSQLLLKPELANGATTSTPYPPSSPAHASTTMRRTGYQADPPSSPSKPPTPRSRIFGNSRNQSRILTPDGSGFTLSPHFEPTSTALYIKQAFDIIRVVGEGSFGKVFEARSKDDRRIYAIKETKRHASASAIEEVKMSRRLGRHPNLVQYHAAWIEQSKLYIQMEFCSRGSLEDLVNRNGPLREERLWDCLTDVLSALHYLHSRHIVHADVKPANIFVSEDGIMKLGDFGLAQQEGAANDQTGDSRYLAPETLKWDAELSPAVDIFSLAISVIDIGSVFQLPSGGQAWQELRHGELRDVWTEGMSPDLRSVLRQMLNPNASERPDALQLLRNPCIAAVFRRRYGLLLPCLQSLMRAVAELFYDLTDYLSAASSRVKDAFTGSSSRSSTARSRPGKDQTVSYVEESPSKSGDGVSMISRPLSPFASPRLGGSQITSSAMADLSDEDDFQAMTSSSPKNLSKIFDQAMEGDGDT